MLGCLWAAALPLSSEARGLLLHPVYVSRNSYARVAGETQAFCEAGLLLDAIFCPRNAVHHGTVDTSGTHPKRTHSGVSMAQLYENNSITSSHFRQSHQGRYFALADCFV
jgi:hypothetical protein